MNKRMNAEVRRLHKEVRMPYCEKCGTRIGLSVHEIYSRGAYGPIIKENMVTLCLECHKLAQRYIIPREDLFALVAQRMEIEVEEVIERVEEERRLRREQPWRFRTYQ